MEMAIILILWAIGAVFFYFVTSVDTEGGKQPVPLGILFGAFWPVIMLYILATKKWS